MSAATLPPPPPPVCLLGTYLSRGVKGGTVIHEGVRDLASHRQRLLDPDGYRGCASPCRTCGEKSLHAHCFRHRILRPASQDQPSLIETIRLYLCPGCGAVFTVLPAVIARHLWRLWKTVEEVSSKGAEAPRSTKRRWFSRLSSSAARLVQALRAVGSHLLGRRLSALMGMTVTRRDLVEAVVASRSVPGNHPFAGLAGWVHRLEPGIRLM
jgi:hypothetical protein